MMVPAILAREESRERWRKNRLGSTLWLRPRLPQWPREVSDSESIPVEPKIKVENRAGLDDEPFMNIVREVSGQCSIRHVVDWLGRHQPPLKVEDMVTQDEFSHDITVPYQESLFLVYDST
jgi:hypothetical protein